MTIESAIILATITGRQADAMSPWLPPINEASRRFAISTAARMAAFLAQVAHESAGFRRLEENLNYSAGGLLSTFHEHFTPEQAAEYARKPQRIANHVYANRMGNGDEASGDGWRFRGMGPIQLTGRALRMECGLALGVDLLARPELLLEPMTGMLSAGWFWDSRGCNELADKDDFVSITKRINGGVNGLEERLALWEKARAALKGSPGGY